ncbi:hypothetical protein NAC44_10935 [Allorhizobium sp. BGMRC 0089]|nr:hypothetical protein [Allorhizobium sonneratiae]
MWQIVGAAVLANRLVLGWVYWGGASRRFIYATQKIDPTSPGYLGNKLVHAAPGAAFGVESILHWLLSMPALLQFAVIFFSLVELVVGVGLIVGFATRFMSILGLGLATALMIIFGWMGSTCLDEWTMAANGFAMASVTLMAGSGPYSVDNWMLSRSKTQPSALRLWLTSGPLPVDRKGFIRISSILGMAAFIFTVFFYGYNFDGIVSPLGKRIDNSYPHMMLSNATVSGGLLSVNSYVNAGPDTQGLYIVRAVLAPSSAKGQEGAIFDYNAAQLSQKGFVKIANTYAPWSSCKVVAYGVRCELGSKANLGFPLPETATKTSTPLTLTLYDIEGKKTAIAVND